MDEQNMKMESLITDFNFKHGTNCKAILDCWDYAIQEGWFEPVINMAKKTKAIQDRAKADAWENYIYHTAYDDCMNKLKKGGVCC